MPEYGKAGDGAESGMIWKCDFLMYYKVFVYFCRYITIIYNLKFRKNYNVLHGGKE